MGQYFLILNLDKKEFLDPHKLGSGLKLLEIAYNNISSIFPLLLRQSSEGGGGDIDSSNPSAGRWAGDRLVVVGDYDKSGLYSKARAGDFKDISLEVREDFKTLIEFGERWDLEVLKTKLGGEAA